MGICFIKNVLKASLGGNPCLRSLSTLKNVEVDTFISNTKRGGYATHNPRKELITKAQMNQ